MRCTWALNYVSIVVACEFCAPLIIQIKIMLLEVLNKNISNTRTKKKKLYCIMKPRKSRGKEI